MRLSANTRYAIDGECQGHRAAYSECAWLQNALLTGRYQKLPDDPADCRYDSD